MPWWELANHSLFLMFFVVLAMALYGVARNKCWGRFFGQGVGVGFWILCCIGLPDLHGWLATAAFFLLVASLSGPVMARRYEDAGSRHHFLNAGTRRSKLLKAALILTVAVNPALILGSGMVLQSPAAFVIGLMAATQLAGAYFLAREKTAGLFLMAATVPGLLAVLFYLQGSIFSVEETKVLRWTILALVALSGFFLWTFARPMWRLFRRPEKVRPDLALFAEQGNGSPRPFFRHLKAKLPAALFLLALGAPIFVLAPLYAARSIRLSLPSYSGPRVTAAEHRTWSLEQSWGELDLEAFREKVMNTKMPNEIRAVLLERIASRMQEGGRTHRAIAHLRTLLQQRPEERARKRHLLMADLLHRTGNTRDAALYLRRAMAAAPPGVYDDRHLEATWLLYSVRRKEGRYWDAFLSLSRWRPREGCGWFYGEMIRARQLIGLYWKGLFQSVFGPLLGF